MPEADQLEYAYFGHIVKYDTTEDGDLYVYGKAAGPDLDLDGQRCDPKWLKSAMPSWQEWGNVREQHSNIAAGVGAELTEGEDGWWLKALVVDEGTKRKVIKRVLKGFSIGIRDGRFMKTASAPNGLINDGIIAEISLVDRPCNPTTTFSIAKSFGAGPLAPVEAEPEAAPAPVESTTPASLETILKALDVPDSTVDATTVRSITPRVRANELAGQSADVSVLTVPVIEKTAGWYREAMRTVEDAYAGLYADTVPLITKAAAASTDEERSDIEAAHGAIDMILDLIVAEAQQAKGGRIKELRDIEVLLSAARSLCYFCDFERAEDDEDDEDAEGDEVYAGRIDMSLTAGGKPATVDVTTEINKAVEAAKTEFERTHEAELAALRGDLEKALGAPKPGGPVVHRVSTTTAPTQANLSKSVQAGELRAIGDRVADPTVRQAYRSAADKVEREGATH